MSSIIIKGIIDERFGDYKDCSMMIITSHCKWKCKECQNKHLDMLPTKKVECNEIIERFFNNPLTSAIIFGGLEPLDTPYDVKAFMLDMLDYCDDHGISPPKVIIYTGYDEYEMEGILEYSGLDSVIDAYRNVIIKYGRYDPTYDEFGTKQIIYDLNLGVYLQSMNQGTIDYFKESSFGERLWNQPADTLTITPNVNVL